MKICLCLRIFEIDVYDSSEPIVADVYLEGVKLVEFQFDTGAYHSMISLDVFNDLKNTRK